MFKKAYVYGTAKALKDLGILKVADDEELEELSEEVAEELPGEEEDYMEPQSDETTAELAAGLVELANSLQTGATAAATAAEAAATLHEEQKNAAWRILKKLGLDAGTGNTVSGETTNTLADAETSEAEMEESQRPAGYANTGVGVQEQSGVGLVGAELPRTGEGGVVVPDENSATETVGKSALWRILNALKKHGQETGATLTPNKKTPDAAAGETIAEKEQRPETYALTGVGAGSSVSGGVIGKEVEHPKQESHEGDTNSASKAAEERRYLQELRRLGQKYASALPFYLNDVEKLAALQYLLGLAPTERTQVMDYVEKTGELPPGLREYVEKRKAEAAAGAGEEAKEEKKAPAKKEEKNAALLRRLRQLSRM